MSEDHFSVRLENVSKIFKPRLRYSRHDRKGKVRLLLTLLGVENSFTASAGMDGADSGRAVLNSISVSFKQASVTGIAGNGGSGKSVLLRIIAGLIPPSDGVIQIRGNLVKLLDIDDLDQSLTARDVFLSETTAKQASRAVELGKFLEFAGLENFADVPIRKFSTGMRLRLAMASVLCGNADVILIDDYSAVGDFEFQKKCRDRIRAQAERGAAVIIASSDQDLLNDLCDEIYWLEDGAIISPGQYADPEGPGKKAEITSLAGSHENHPLRLVHASVRDSAPETGSGFSCATPLRFELSVEALADINRVRLAFTLYNRGKQVLRTVLRDSVALARGCRLDAEADLPAFILAPGPHEVELVAQADFSGRNVYIRLRSGLSFFIHGQQSASPWGAKRSRDPVVSSPDLEWKCVPVP